jgi:hypothetical protein
VGSCVRGVVRAAGTHRTAAVEHVDVVHADVIDARPEQPLLQRAKLRVVEHRDVPEEGVVRWREARGQQALALDAGRKGHRRVVPEAAECEAAPARRPVPLYLVAREQPEAALLAAAHPLELRARDSLPALGVRDAEGRPVRAVPVGPQDDVVVDGLHAAQGRAELLRGPVSEATGKHDEAVPIPGPLVEAIQRAGPQQRPPVVRRLPQVGLLMRRTRTRSRNGRELLRQARQPPPGCHRGPGRAVPRPRRHTSWSARYVGEIFFHRKLSNK